MVYRNLSQPPSGYMIAVNLISRIGSTFIFETKHAKLKAGERELICLLSIYCAFVVYVIKNVSFSTC